MSTPTSVNGLQIKDNTITVADLDVNNINGLYPSLSQSRAQHAVFIGPIWSDGAPTFRLLDSSDLPAVTHATNADTSSLATGISPGTYSITSSWAVNASTAALATGLNNTTYNMTAAFANGLTGGSYNISASWASASISASYAKTSSYATNASTAALATGISPGTYSITSSWATTASYADNSSKTNIFATTLDSNFYLTFITSAFSAMQSLYADNNLKYNPSTTILSVPIIAATSVTASLKGTASWATNASTAALATGISPGTYSITSSWAVNASTAALATGISPGTYSITSSLAFGLTGIPIRITGSIVGNDSILSIYNSTGGGGGNTLNLKNAVGNSYALFDCINSGTGPIATFSGSGNVGIGITNPLNALHVYTTTVADGISLDGTTDPCIVLRSAGVVRGYAPVVVTAPGDFFANSLAGDMGFRSEGYRILFGIGGASPAFLL